MPDPAKLTLPAAQVPSQGGRTELATPQSDRFVGLGGAEFTERILDIPEAQSELVLKTQGVTDDPGREAVASTQRFHPSVVLS